MPPRPAEAKNQIHELALAFGRDDPTKPDYSRFLPNRRRGERTNVKPLQHGAYKNLEQHLQEVARLSATMIQACYRGRVGRSAILFEKRRIEFFQSEINDKQQARRDVESEFAEQELSSGIIKVKWNAKVRIKQVKLRAAGQNADREVTLASMMDEETALRHTAIEEKYSLLADQRGFLRIGTVSAAEAFLRFKARQAGKVYTAAPAPATKEKVAAVEPVVGVSTTVADVWDRLDDKRALASEGGIFGLRRKRLDLRDRLRLMERMRFPPNVFNGVGLSSDECEVLEHFSDPCPRYAIPYDVMSQSVNSGQIAQTALRRLLRG